MTGDLLTLGEIQFGEPDANAEYFAALRGHRQPLFIHSFLMTQNFPWKELLSGEKFLLYGQKGTGKTATLRYLENEVKDSGPVQFLIFKKAFIEELDLQQISSVPLVVDEEEIKKFKHYHHALKRVFIYILISLVLSDREAYDDSDLDPEQQTVFDRLRKSKIGEVIKIAFDSLTTLLEAARIDVSKATGNRILFDAGLAIKRSNDDLLEKLCQILREASRPVRLIIDEIHFAYRSEESLQQDAILVRDCILAVQALNERFAQEGSQCYVYAAVRSEYLEHPIIATADINHTVESVGVNVSWSTYKANKDHPLFQLLFNRVAAGIPRRMDRRRFMRVYFANIDPALFLSRTWNKPRDFIRYFNCAKTLFPQSITLTQSQANTVWRIYAQEAWNEVKSAASPFLNPAALAVLEDIMRTHTPRWFENDRMTVDEFAEIIRPVYERAKGDNRNFYDFRHFLHLLYILGLFGTRHEQGNEAEPIYQTYHRGNRSFHMQGRVQIHPAVLKAFG